MNRLTHLLSSCAVIALAGSAPLLSAEHKTTTDSQKEETVVCVDGDGNRYATVKIGNQLWMAENLRTTKYNDGTPIPVVTGDKAWVELTSPAYCFYKNDPATAKAGYGALYNGFAVLGEGTGGKSICPAGWHVATDAEWSAMEVYLENHGFNYDGTNDTDNDPLTNNKIAKALTSTKGWVLKTSVGSPGSVDFPEFRNKSGFNAMPAGFRNGVDGVFYGRDRNGYYWTGSAAKKGMHWRYFNQDKEFVRHVTAGQRFGYAVRCIWDGKQAAK